MSTNSDWLSTTNKYIKYRIETTLNSQNSTNNSSNITVKVWIYRTNTGYTTSGSGTCYCKINGTTYTQSITSSQKITHSGIYLFSKTLDIGHNSDGTKSMDITAWFDHYSFSSTEGGYNISLPNIPRKSTISGVSGTTIGGQMTVYINRASSSFTTSAWLQLGNSGWVGVANQSTSTSFSFTIPTSLANQIPNSNSGNGQVIIRTYDANGNSLGDSSYGVTFSVPSYSPSIGTFTVSEEGTGLGIYVQNKSKIKCTGGASTSYGASIASYTWTIGSATLSGSQVTTGTWGSSGDVTVKLTVKDSRGKTASRSTTITFVAYSVPVASLSVQRCNSDGTYSAEGTYIKCVFSGAVASVNNTNTISVKLQTKINTSTAWIDQQSYTTEQNDTSVVLSGFSTDNAYDVKLTVTDKWATTIKTVSVGTAFVTMDFKNGGTGIAIGKVATLDNTLDIALHTKMSNGLELGNSTAGVIKQAKTDGTLIKSMYVTSGDNFRIGDETLNTYIYSSSNPVVNVGGTSYTMYHTGNKPTPGDIGAATSSHTHSGYAASNHTHPEYASQKGTEQIWSGSVVSGQEITISNLKNYNYIMIGTKPGKSSCEVWTTLPRSYIEGTTVRYFQMCTESAYTKLAIKIENNQLNLLIAGGAANSEIKYLYGGW